MPKYPADYGKPLVKDLERSASIAQNAALHDNKALRESLMLSTAMAQNATLHDNKALRESLMLSTAMAQNATLYDNKALRESLMLSTAMAQNAKIPDIEDLRANFMRAAAISERSNEHGDNHAETEYNHDLDYQSTEEPNHAIEEHNEVLTSTTPNQHQITETLATLREETKTSQDISSQRHTEILKRLESLSEQVKLAASERKPGLIKLALLGLGAALSKLSDLTELWSQWNAEIKNFLRMLAELWSRWGDAIKNFFGFHE